MGKALADYSPTWRMTDRPLEIASRLLPAIFLAALFGLSTSQSSAEDRKVWAAGYYSFSDEMGGFKIRAISGQGTRQDPIVIEEELYSASPVTMVVRADTALASSSLDGNLAAGALYLRIVTANASRQAWIEFEFELQELLHKPSEFGDGLSFDQRTSDNGEISSTAFRRHDRDFEPYDRLLFTEGKVDPGKQSAFVFALTDFTPRWEFYIVQDPRIPSS